MMEESEMKELVEKITDKKLKVENNDIFRVMVALNNRVKQLYQQTYNPPTNNDLNKSINTIVDRLNTIDRRIKDLR
jgi:hypothetical protein